MGSPILTSSRRAGRQKDEFCEDGRHPEGLQAEPHGAGTWAEHSKKPVNIPLLSCSSRKIITCLHYSYISFCRFGGAVKSSNMTPPWGTSSPWSSSEGSSEMNSSSGPFNWNSSNVARHEQGITFYSQVRQGK